MDLGQFLFIGLSVAIGGFAGGILRWWLSTRLTPHRGALGIFLANVAASLLVGCLEGGRSRFMAAPFSVAPETYAIALALGSTGLAGTLSTWSTFAKQVCEAFLARRWRAGTLYLVATIGACIFAAWLGHAVFRLG